MRYYVIYNNIYIYIYSDRLGRSLLLMIHDESSKAEGFTMTSSSRSSAATSVFDKMEMNSVLFFFLEID